MIMHTNNGFTIVECMVALAILVCIISLSFSFGTVFNRYCVAQEVYKLQATCRYLQRCAQVTHTIKKLVIDSERHCYSYDDRTEYLPSKVHFGVADGVCGPPSSPLHPIHNPVTFVMNCVEFYPNGVISSGTIYLCDLSKTVTHALSNAVAHIPCLRHYRHNGGVWYLME